ncbi:MAG: PD-(D/E)XK nuclease family protein [Anaerolineaceae bacterium]|nr:PD-(D/E)XK nuclease family protein [Anaerolineaceae bacterium]
MTNLMSSNFVFSQSSLQTFDYCPRRFYLRYLKKLVWPAQMVSEQNQSKDRDSGVRFHQLIHQYFLGFELETLRKIADYDSDSRMAVWFENFLQSPFAHLPGTLNPESSFKTEIAGYQLIAKVDLLQIHENQIKIYDWKTSQHLPKASNLLKQAQSQVYPLVISRAIEPKSQKLSLIYWEANFPDQTIELESNSSDWQKFENDLSNQISEIVSLKEEEFVMTDDKQKCGWCEYRSFCHRAVSAEQADESYDLESFDEIKIPEEIDPSWEP